MSEAFGMLSGAPLANVVRKPDVQPCPNNGKSMLDPLIENQLRRVFDNLIAVNKLLSLRAHTLDRMDDEAVIETLTQVKGVGRWTAEMFLIFRLQRLDVLPVGDLGIVKAVQRAYKLRKAPTPDRLTRIGEAWRPYRSVACWYLWASLNNAPTKD